MKSDGHSTRKEPAPLTLSPAPLRVPKDVYGTWKPVDPLEDKNAKRKEIEEHTQQFLSNGGQIQQVKPGCTGYREFNNRVISDK